MPHAARCPHHVHGRSCWFAHKPSNSDVIDTQAPRMSCMRLRNCTDTDTGRRRDPDNATH
eukprot:1227909-Alexandrium_andersonii.AAC.1